MSNEGSSLPIPGFSIGGYRSFGHEPQRIGPLSKVNLFVGANNSGKSNILRYMVEHFGKCVAAIHQRSPYVFAGLDVHQGAPKVTPALTLAVPNDRREIQALLRTSAMSQERQGLIDESVAFIVDVLHHDALLVTEGLTWIDLEVPAGSESWRPTAGVVKAFTDTNPTPFRAERWHRLWAELLQRGGGDLRKNWVPESLLWIAQRSVRAPEAFLVPAVRQITAEQQGFDELSGRALIKQLAELQNPSITAWGDKEKFNAIQEFVRTVVGAPDARLEVPHERNTIHVTIGEQTLPIEHLGTGIHEVIILAVAATVKQGAILCLEEPELHLNPTLQKQLVLYLQEKTSNQYLISTHSAHFLDTADATIFHVSLKDRSSRVVRRKSTAEKLEVCADLGYRASDLLQSNCVIWVEGPSDRIYILRWLQDADPELEEGIHLSIMFYGGRLLRHLSANDADVSEFISLRRLNQNLVLVVDSDRPNAAKPLNATKTRVLEEVGKHGGLAWVTAGRTIENYLDPSVLSEVIQKVHPGLQCTVSGQRYASVFSGLSNPDKVRIAHRVCTDERSMSDRLDMRERVQELTRFVRKANGMAAQPASK